MKHALDADVNVNVDIPTQDLEDLIDKITDSTVTIIKALTVAYVVKSIFNPR